jgi:DNA-binding response OmpR family regulator
MTTMTDSNRYIHSSKNHKGIILLVSGSKKSKNSLIKQLSPNGYKVIVANDGFDALKKLRSMQVDLIITRLKLPKMDCLELMMNLRDLNIECPVIIIEEKGAREGNGLLSTVDVCGYCCSPGIKTKMLESIDLITK